MNRILREARRMFSIPLDATDEERRRRLVNILLVVTTVTALLGLMVGSVADAFSGTDNRDDITMLHTAVAAMLLSNALVFVVNRFSSRLAGWLFALLILVAALFSNTPQQIVSGRGLTIFALPVVVASILLHPYTSLVVASLGSLAVAVVALRLSVAVPTPAIVGLFLVALISALLAQTWQRTMTDLRIANRNLALLNQASRALSSTLDLDQVLINVLDEVRHLLNVVACSVWLIDPETDELVCRQATGPQSESVRGWRLTLDEGVVGWVARTRESQIVPDTRTDEHYFEGVDESTSLGLRSILSVPLRVRQDVIGVLQVVDREVDRFKLADLELLEPLAATAAIAIENARLYAEEQQRAAALTRTLEQQRELDRLKDQFIQNVSHELRTPVAIIQGYAELLDSSVLGELQPDQREPVTAIVRRVRMLSELVDDLTAILAIEAQELKREPVDLADLIRPLLTDFQVAAEQAGLCLTAEIASDLPQVSGEPDYLYRMLNNLLGNAFKFTPAGGSVTVRLWQDEANVMLEVADTGIGIPREQLKRIFDRFYQVDGSTTRRYGGTGLGLALVKEIVEAHGGQVTVRSSVGEGSIFQVRLPLG
ncbi:MAG: ATP-binding protein [Anaerolineae bacterium]